MAVKRWTLITFPGDEPGWVFHKVGCPKVKEEVAAGGQKEMIKIDLDASDEELIEEIDPEETGQVEDMEFCACTGYAVLETDHEEPAKPKPSPAASASRAAAMKRLLTSVEETIDKLVVKRGVDDIGEGDKWHKEKLVTCTDDYVYDLAVEVRKLRERGEAWWRVAYELGLPGSGASNKQGRKGSAFARRLWRAAWGKTYTGERGVRDSKANREQRALINLGRPFFSEADTDAQVIQLVSGQMIHWVTRLDDAHGGLVTSAQETYVHHDPKLIRIVAGRKGRVLEFFEQLDSSMLMVDPRKAITKSGPLRSVYVDRITRVGV